ncbi:MAG: integrase core domain-containing protein [Chloroflexota bacterium]
MRSAHGVSIWQGTQPRPTVPGITQQARQLVWHLTDDPHNMRFLIHDDDTKFSATFDNVFVSEGIEIVFTPFRAPKANAVTERWVGSVRIECLDQLLILNRRHLWNVLTEYIGYYNTARPHQGLAQQSPLPFQVSQEGRIHCRDVWGGVIHDSYRQVA